MEILKIKINNQDQPGLGNSLLRRNSFVLFVLLVGTGNIVLEFLIRKKFSTIRADSLTEALHLIIYFIIPFLFSKKSLKIIHYFFIVLFFFLSATIYVLIGENILPLYLYFIYPVILVALIIYLFKEKKVAKKLLVNFGSWKETILYTILAIVLSVGHLFFVLSLSHGYQIQKLNAISVLPNISYMVFAAFGMEVFFRGFIFRRLNSVNKIPFWLSASITTVLYIGPFLANPFFTRNIVLLTSTIFYLVLLGFVFCALTKKTKSIVPSYILSIIMSILRYLIIFGTI